MCLTVLDYALLFIRNFVRMNVMFVLLILFSSIRSLTVETADECFWTILSDVVFLFQKEKVYIGKLNMILVQVRLGCL